MTVLTFKPESLTKNFISGLKDRTKDVVVQRYGLGNEVGRKTLESIGQKYGITRERVRQIENFALNSIRQNPSFEAARDNFAEIQEIIDKKGKVVSEREILDCLADNPKQKNHVFFLLILGNEFEKIKEDEEFHHRWTIDKREAEAIHAILRNLHNELNESELVPEQEIIALLKKRSEDNLKRKISDEILRSWLNISKIIASNALGEWGLTDSPRVNPRGMRDFAFLVLRKQGSPMHFTEVSEKISDYFSRQAHSATVHNELIKDARFVLVGRGLYALEEWGYKTGAVKDVIKEIIKLKGPLTKEEIIDIVSKERYVKKNTIIINLQNRDYFTKNRDGKYVFA